MNKEFLKMQKIAGLITESQVKEIIGDIDDTPHPDGDFDPAKAYADDDEYENDETFNIIDSIIGEKLKDNFIKSVEAIQSTVEAAGNKDIDRGDVYDYLLMMMEEDN